MLQHLYTLSAGCITGRQWWHWFSCRQPAKACLLTSLQMYISLILPLMQCILEHATCF